MDLKLSLDEQLGMFEKPNAAELLLNYAKISKEMHNAVHAKYFTDVENVKIAELFKGAYAQYRGCDKKLQQEIMEALTSKEANDCFFRGGYFHDKTLMKLFDLPEDIAKNIIMEYVKGGWEFSDAVQLKMLETFSEETLKEILLRSNINEMRRESFYYFLRAAPLSSSFITLLTCVNYFQLCNKAQVLVIEKFSKEEAERILGKLAEPDVETLEKILEMYSEKEAKGFLFSLMEYGALFTDAALLRMLEVFPKDDAKDLCLAYARKGYTFEWEVQQKIFDIFPEDDITEIFSEYEMA